MPATSAKQERFMQAVAHNPKFAKQAGVPQSVGKEFTGSPSTRATINRPDTSHGKMDMPYESVKTKGLKGKKFCKGGGIEVKGKTKGRMV